MIETFLARMVMPRSALQRVAVQQAFLRQLAVTEIAALLEQSIHQRRLAMVDVGDDRNISNIVSHRIHSMGPK